MNTLDMDIWDNLWWYSQIAYEQGDYGLMGFFYQEYQHWTGFN